MERLTSTETYICLNQGRLFVLAQESGYDIVDFIEKFMNSRFANVEWDAKATFCQTAPPEYNIYDCIEEFNPSKAPKKYDDASIEWIGYIYRYVQRRLGVHSQDIIKALPFKDMLIWYEGMHTQSEEFFLEDVVAGRIVA